MMMAQPKHHIAPVPANQTLEQAISQALLVDTPSKKKETEGKKEKKHKKHHKHKNGTAVGTEEPQKTP